MTILLQGVIPYPNVLNFWAQIRAGIGSYSNFMYCRK